MTGMGEGWEIIESRRRREDDDVIAFYDGGWDVARKDFGSGKEAARQVELYKKAIWRAFRTRLKVSVHKRGTCIELWREE